MRESLQQFLFAKCQSISSSFQERLANNSKIMTFTGVPLFDALVRRFP